MTVLLGGYSDATGRKVALVPPLIGAAVRLVLFIVIVFFDLHPGFLILASICDGLGGGMCAMFMASLSYVASITSHRSRSRRIVVVEYSAGLAVVTSNLSMGYAIHVLGYAWTFVVLIGILFIALCYVVFILRETEPVSAITADQAKFLTAEHFRRVLALYVKDDTAGLERHWKLRFTFLLVGMTSAIQVGGIDTETLFMLSAPLCFTAVWIGYFYAAEHFVKSLTTLVLTHVFVRHAGDLILVFVGLVFGAGYELMFGLSTNRVMLFMGKYMSCSTDETTFLQFDK